ncbi:DNA-binding protein HU domain-containing protein [Theileria equi strain WA]|uniref:DNA-binding protein HU domain-containing protein n=1 Tax=Theileria equi strain WA TaxID=1537102 RepID=L0AZA2_THEEQ|nr:DNA-binding protein HU domain-containing protein [Theileria equi strain WA]AFZ80902.1 DNA-binding protein HU domain-containing protein [Theileria equi strain WA]|eukprot:XP_004830568.1 DNA-binding protein HU domain-containing protein [Theileria equi strain WA]
MRSFTAYKLFVVLNILAVTCGQYSSSSIVGISYHVPQKAGFLTNTPPSFTSQVKRHAATYAGSSNVKETVTKRQLITEVAETLNKTQKEVGAVVDEFIKSITKHLGENSEVSISKFGVFHNSLRGERRMRNLQTGEIFMAKPVYVPNLRFSDTLKSEINDKLKGKKQRFTNYTY